MSRNKIINVDYDAFESNGIDSIAENSWIINQFNAKNKRVNAIFRDDGDDEDIFGQRQSHGIRLLSIAGISRTSDKENAAASTQHSSGHMQALSPKSVHEAAPEDINEIRPRIVSNPRRSDLRRSLFRASEQRQMTTSTNEITCSTPMLSRPRTSSFIDANINISPIRNSSKQNPLNGIEEIESQPQQKTPVKVDRVSTLGNIEKSLREQFDVDNEKTPRKRGEKSFISEPGEKGAKNLISMRRTSAPGLTLTKQCSIVIESMEMSDAVMKTYQQSRMSKCNKTDMRTMNVPETPIINKNRVVCDEELAKRLQMCESSTNMTSDEDEIPEQEAIVPQLTDPGNNLPFLQPKTPQRDSVSITSQDSSINKIVSQNVMESFKDLRRTVTNHGDLQQSIQGLGSNSSAASQSCRLHIAKKMKMSKQASAPAEEYMKLTNKRKKSKNSSQNIKRTLYSHHSDEDDNVSPQSSTSSISQKKSSDEVIYQQDKSEATGSNTDSDAQNFRRPYKPGPLKTKKKYGVVNDKQSSIQIVSSSTTTSDDENAEICETPKTSRTSTQKSTKKVQSEEKKLQRKSKRSAKNRQNEEQEKLNQEEIVETRTRGSKKITQTEGNSSINEPEVQSSNKSLRQSRRNEDDNSAGDVVENEENENSEIDENREEPILEVSKKKKEKSSRLKRDKRQEAEEPALKGSKKRKKPDDDHLTLRRQKMVKPSETDEGLGDSDDSDFDVKYVSDNERYSFRKRRYCRPWWIRTAPENMRIQYENLSKSDFKAEKKIRQIKMRTGINPINACHGNKVFQPPPTEMLKIMEELEIDKKKNVKITKFLNAKQSKEKNIPNDRSETTHTSSSVQTSVTSFTPSEAIHQAFQDLSNAKGSGRVVETTDAYDLAQFDNIEWVVCNNGIHFYGFLGQQGDGLIKLLPGSAKDKSRTKKTILKFMILCGEVTFIINDVERTIKNFGYVNIRQGYRYEIQNRSERDAIISFTRLNPNDCKELE